MVVFPNVKINLGLHVIKKRTDGFHNIETVFYPVPGFYDVLEVIKNTNDEGDDFNVTGLIDDLQKNDNLVIKALKLLRTEHRIPGLKIHLHKNIPAGAGLGGGSSDAAFMLKLLNDQFRLGIPDQKLEQKASLLGADCAFFIRNAPTLAKGTGNEFTPVKVPLNNLWIMLVAPPAPLSTPEAYKNIIPSAPSEKLESILKEPIETWRHKMVNDFEFNTFKKYPELAAIKNKFYNQDAIYASMSGSGSAFYGIFRDEPKIQWPKSYVCWKGQIK